MSLTRAEATQFYNFCLQTGQECSSGRPRSPQRILWLLGQQLAVDVEAHSRAQKAGKTTLSRAARLAEKEAKSERRRYRPANLDGGE